LYIKLSGIVIENLSPGITVEESKLLFITIGIGSESDFTTVAGNAGDNNRLATTITFTINNKNIINLGFFNFFISAESFIFYRFFSTTHLL
jgi:hypothetical protein